MRINAITLLDKCLNFIKSVPNEITWSFGNEELNPLQVLKLQQIESMLSAFFPNKNTPNHKITIQSFLKGDFISLKGLENYSEAISTISKYVKEHAIIEVKTEINLNELTFIFPLLIDLKTKLHSIKNHNSGWVSSNSKTAQFAIHLNKSIERNISHEYDKLDSVLELIISPEKLLFTEAELIKGHNYPNKNTDNLEIECF